MDKIILFSSKLYFLAIEAINSSLNWGGYRLNILLFIDLEILLEHPRGFSFADKRITFFESDFPKFGL